MPLGVVPPFDDLDFILKNNNNNYVKYKNKQVILPSRFEFSALCDVAMVAVTKATAANSGPFKC